MSESGDLGELNTRDWHHLQNLADALEDAWKKGQPVDLKNFLPPPGSSARAAILRELIKTDLECRWRRGHPAVLDYYLERFADDLGSAQTLPADLVFEEYRVRQAYGDRPPLGLYK